MILLALAFVFAFASSLTLAQTAAVPGEEFAKAHRLVDIGGRKLNLYCTGSGSPTVIFEAPSSAAGWVWWEVQPVVAAATRACVYDRAGYGFSDSAPHVADIDNAVTDLHRLLAAAGENPPYVLAGNSLGGAMVELYAWRYPAEVRGLVLIEPMHEDENIRADVPTKGKISEAEADILAFGDGCADQAEKGFVMGSDSYAQCIGGADMALPAALRDADLRQRLAPQHWCVYKAERHAFARDRGQLRAARKPFGDLPLIVLARGVSPYLVPGQPQSEVNKAIEAANLALQTQVATSSSQGKIQVVSGAGHVIQETHPQAVAAAVAGVLARVKAGVKASVKTDAGGRP